MHSDQVLVTGGSGFLGAHIIVALLNAGYRGRTTVRSLSRENEVRDVIAAGGADAGDRLAFTSADLTTDTGWPAAVDGCDYVLHVASPFPAADPEDEDDVIVPAREGTLRVLKAGRDAGVKRVVVTGSYVAIGYGHRPEDREFTEDDWTNADSPDVNTYARPSCSPNAPGGTSSTPNRLIPSSPSSTPAASSARSSARTSQRRSN
jgi:nucleoside-diphosphate-sugar epimerase